MLKLIKKWLLDKALFNALSISILIVFLSLINPTQLPTKSIQVSDKFLHALAYTVLMWGWLLVFRHNNSYKTRGVILISLFLFGFILEYLQGAFTSYRTADWKDLIANTSGLIIGLLSYKFVYRQVFT